MQFDIPSSERLGQKSRWRYLPLGVLALVTAMTASLAVWTDRVHRSEERALLERRTEAFGIALSGRVQAYVDTLPGLRQFSLVRSTPNDLEFSQYVEAISLQRRFPGLALIFFGERVKATDLDRYVGAVRADTSLIPEGHPGWTIQPPGERPEYMVLRHLNPFDAVTFGYDVYDPSQTYRPAVDKAIATGSYTATGPLLLARDRFSNGRPQLTSVVIRMPLYAGGGTPASVSERIERATGVVGISFRALELVGSVMPAELKERARVLISDVDARREGRNHVVYHSHWAANDEVPASLSDKPALYAIDVADRTWEISVVPAPRTAGATLSSDTWLVIGLGGLVAASLSVMTLTLVNANGQAEARVRAATAELQAERDSLEKSESRYRMIFENSHEAMLRTRLDGAILAANPAAVQLFGLSEAQMRQLARGSIVDESDPRLPALLAERSQSGHAHGLVCMFKANGSTFEAELTSSVYIDADGQTVTSLVVRDVTERVHVQAHQDMLTEILNSMPDFVGSVDTDGRNIFLNRAWRRVLGRDDAADLSSLRIGDCHPPWAAEIVRTQGVPAALKHGVWSGETAILAGDGRQIPVLQVILCHRQANGTVTHLSTIAHDLSELKRAENVRLALEAQLRESQKMESVGTLAGGVAHDFNNVLVAILGNSTLATEALDATHPAQQNLARIKRAASRARTLVQQILTFSRRTTQEFTVQGLGPIVEEGVGLLRSTLPATVHLGMSIPAEPLFVRADAAQLEQVVMNLCTNAWQALPDGRGAIEVSLEAVSLAAGDVLPNGLQPGRHARIRVRDNGTGMDAGTRERVFEPFFTTKRVGEGTGLGLAVVHGIVIAVGGAITIDSLPGAGSTFDVYLPCQARPEGSTEPEADRLEEQRGAGERVLYIDDDEVVALTMRALLERSGYRVTSHSNGTDAMEELRADARSYSLVISDFNMPDMSGIAVAKLVRELDPELPVVITSGYVTDELQERARSAGIRAVLLKEYSLERLGTLVHNLLRRT